MNDLTSEKDNEKTKKQLYLPFSVDRILQIDRNCEKKVKLECDLTMGDCYNPDTEIARHELQSSTDSSSPEPLSDSDASQDILHSSNKVHSDLQVRSGISVKLMDNELWQKFHSNGTEMIITKAGRRMFPCLKIRVADLDPEEMYMFFIEIVPFDNKRYRYVYLSSKWAAAGAGDPLPDQSTFLHPESPASGKSWMSQNPIMFDKLKLTNNRLTLSDGQVCLHSMHKYLPKIHILPLSKIGLKDFDCLKSAKLDELRDFCVSFTFPQTAFTTVTAYQNQQITRLKIESNPFAKGFREATRSRDVGYPPDLSDCRGNVFEFPLGSGQRFYPPSLGVLNGVSQVQGFHGLAYLPPYPPPPPEWWFMQYLPRRTTGQHSCTGFNNVTHVTNCTNRTNDRLEPPEED